MKNLKTIIAIFGSIILFSCSKDEEKPVAIVYAEENPIAEFVTSTRINEFVAVVNTSNTSPTEIGFSFKPIVSGKINSIFLRIPTIGASVRITIWDVATRFPIYTGNNITNTSNEPAGNIISINPITLIKDKEYMITMNTSYYYQFRRTDYSAINYPVANGNILITGFYYAITPSGNRVFPIDSYQNLFQGNVSFNFQRTE